MTSEERKFYNIRNNRINTKSINDELSSIIDTIIKDGTYQEGKNRIQTLFKLYIYNEYNEKKINLCLTIINNIIILKGNNKYKILSVIPEICQINPKRMFNHVDIILSIFQSCLTDDNSPYYSQISQYFGDTVKALLIDLKSENYDTYIINSNNNQNMNNNLNNDKNLFLVYTKFKLFCLSNIKSNNAGCQICGTLCLTSFIENCSFNYVNNENLKCIFEILSTQINNPNYPGKLELLNCFISLVFCSEEKYIPYSITTLNIIIKFIHDPEWLIRKFSLNIIYTMLFYCKKEILDKKQLIIENLHLLKNETNIEIKEIADQIYKMISENESINISYKTHKNNILSDSLIDSNNSKFSSGELTKKNINNYSMSEKQFQIEEEKNGKEIGKQKTKTSTTTGISKSKFSNSNSIMKNKNEKPQFKTKSDYNRKRNNKSNKLITETFVNNSSSKKLFPKFMNTTNHNGNLCHSYKKRNVFSDNYVNKNRNKQTLSRNSVDKINRNNPISMIYKKRNILVNNYNSVNQDKNYRFKPKVKQNNLYNIHSFDKSKQLFGFKPKPNFYFKYLSRKKNNKIKIYSINNINKNARSINIKSNNIKNQPNIKGRNDIIKQNNYISNTTIYINNNSLNNKNIISLNKIPSFGPGSEEDINNPLYSDEIMEDINSGKDINIENKDKLLKIKKQNKHNYSFENKKSKSKNIFMNKSLENEILNNSGNASNKNLDNIIKIHNTIGNNNIHQYKNNKPKSKQIFKPLYNNRLNNNQKISSNNRYRYNDTKQTNKNDKISKMNKKRMSSEFNNNLINNLINKNNYDKDSKSKLNQIDSKYLFSPDKQTKDTIDKLFYTFTNRFQEENSINDNRKENENQYIKKDNIIMKHKPINSFQINNNNKNNNTNINTSSINNTIDDKKKNINNNININNNTNNNNINNNNTNNINNINSYKMNNYNNYNNRKNNNDINNNNNYYSNNNYTNNINNYKIYNCNNNNNYNSKKNINNNNYNNNTYNIKTRSIRNKYNRIYKNKKPIQMDRDNNTNNKDIQIKNNINNVNINNNIASIKDNASLKESKNNDLNFELISKNDNKKDDNNEIELKFKEYKNETSKIINDLKMQVNILRTTLGNFEESTKQKEKLNNYVKNNNFIEAFKTAVEIGNIQDIYYVIKKYQVTLEKDDIPSDVLANIMKILCEDILSCENLRLTTIFIINNICDKNIKFDKSINKEIFNAFNDLYNKRKELWLLKKDITNILKIANYFNTNN